MFKLISSLILFAALAETPDECAARLDLDIETRDGVNKTESLTHPGWGDAFTEEWRAFHNSLVSGEPAKASPQDFRQDLLLYREMIQHMAQEAGLPA